MTLSASTTTLTGYTPRQLNGYEIEIADAWSHDPSDHAAARASMMRWIDDRVNKLEPGTFSDAQRSGLDFEVDQTIEDNLGRQTSPIAIVDEMNLLMVSYGLI